MSDVAITKPVKVYPSPPLKVGEKVRLLGHREFFKGELSAGSEHIVAMIESHHFPPRGKDALDPARDYGIMLHKNGLVVRGRKLIAWYPVSAWEVERIEKQYHDGGFNRDPHTVYVVQNHWNADCFHVCKGSMTFPEGVTQPPMKTVEEAVAFARSHGFEPVLPKHVRECKRVYSPDVSEECDAAELRALERIRANRKPPFWLSPVLPRPYPCPQITVEMKVMERMNAVGSADRFDWKDRVQDRLPAGSPKIKSNLRGLIEYGGIQYAITGGVYAPTYIKATAWRVISPDSQWACKIVRPSDVAIHEIGYHGMMAICKGKPYILVGPEIDFVAPRVKEKHS